MAEMACKDLPERQVSVDIFPTVHETKLHRVPYLENKNIQSSIHDKTMTITIILTTTMTVTITMKLTISGFRCHAIQKRSK